jgi:predicted phage tail protein
MKPKLLLVSLLAVCAASVETASAQTVNGARVTLAWDAPAGGPVVSGYLLSVGSTAGLSNLAAFWTGQTTVTVENVPAGTYFVRVQSMTAEGISPPSNELQIVVAAPAPPAVPTQLSAAVSGRTVQLNWAAPAGGAASYVIEAGSAPGLANLASFATGTSGTAFVTAGVPPGRYYVRVRGANNLGVGAASNEIIVTVR